MLGRRGDTKTGQTHEGGRIKTSDSLTGGRETYPCQGSHHRLTAGREGAPLPLTSSDGRKGEGLPSEGREFPAPTPCYRGREFPAPTPFGDGFVCRENGNGKLTHPWVCNSSLVFLRTLALLWCEILFFLTLVQMMWCKILVFHPTNNCSWQRAGMVQLDLIALDGWCFMMHSGTMGRNRSAIAKIT